MEANWKNHLFVYCTSWSKIHLSLFRRLVEKSEKINATILALKKQGMDEMSPAVQELDEMMTEQEKQQLSKLKTVQSKCVLILKLSLHITKYKKIKP